MQHLISLFFGTSALLSATHTLDGFSNSDKRKKEDFLFNTRELKEVALSTRSLFQIPLIDVVVVTVKLSVIYLLVGKSITVKIQKSFHKTILEIKGGCIKHLAHLV